MPAHLFSRRQAHEDNVRVINTAHKIEMQGLLDENIRLRFALRRILDVATKSQHRSGVSLTIVKEIASNALDPMPWYVPEDGGTQIS